MKSTKEYGEFFPVQLSPFPYQVTQAYEFFPMKEQKAKEKSFSWYETSRQNYKITLHNHEIPDNIRDVKENILHEVIECAQKETCEHECTGAFRIIQQELDFLRRMNIPLPRLCPNCRHYERLLLRNSLILYKRNCMCDKQNHFHGAGRCDIDFETSYAPEKPEIVYCESCYNKEIY